MRIIQTGSTAEMTATMTATTATSTTTSTPKGACAAAPLDVHARWWAVAPGTRGFSAAHRLQITHGRTQDAAGSAEVAAASTSPSPSSSTAPSPTTNSTSTNLNTTPEPVSLVLDCDPGVDDAIALLYTLRSPRVKLLAVTLTQGNTTIANCTRNLAAIVDVVGADCGHDTRLLEGLPKRDDGRRVLRAAAGRGMPLTGDVLVADYFHGADGLGDVRSAFAVAADDAADNAVAAAAAGAVDPVPPSESRAAQWRNEVLEWAAHPAEDELLNVLRREPPNTVVVCAVGPLTNIARALRKDPATMRRARALFVMGGAISLPGNITPLAEFNFYADPTAAREVVAAALGARATQRFLPESMQRLADDAREAAREASTEAAAQIAACVDGNLGHDAAESTARRLSETTSLSATEPIEHADGLLDLVLFSLDATTTIGAVDSRLMLDAMSVLSKRLETSHVSSETTSNLKPVNTNYHSGHAARFVSQIMRRSAGIYRSKIQEELAALKATGAVSASEATDATNTAAKFNLFMHDPLTVVAAALGADVVRCDPEELVVEPDGTYAKGSCIVDLRYPNRARTLRRLHAQIETDARGVFVCSSGDNTVFLDELFRVATGCPSLDNLKQMLGDVENRD